MPRRELNYGAAVYGSVLATALVGALFEQPADARSMTISLAGSIVVFWLAHAWANVVGERMSSGRLFDRARVRAVAVDEWPLVEAGFVPTLLLAGAWVGVYARDTGARLALAAAILQLVGWGALAGRRSEPHWSRALLVGAIDGLLGLAIVGLEVAVH